MLSLKPVASGEEPEAVQVNNVPVTFDVRVTLGLVLLQIALDAGKLERLAPGKTVTVKSVAFALQPLAMGVT